jgi:hypothetical protein
MKKSIIAHRTPCCYLTAPSGEETFLTQWNANAMFDIKDIKPE